MVDAAALHTVAMEKERAADALRAEAQQLRMQAEAEAMLQAARVVTSPRQPKDESTGGWKIPIRVPAVEKVAPVRAPAARSEPRKQRQQVESQSEPETDDDLAPGPGVVAVGVEPRQLSARQRARLYAESLRVPQKSKRKGSKKSHMTKSKIEDRGEVGDVVLATTLHGPFREVDIVDEAASPLPLTVAGAELLAAEAAPASASRKARPRKPTPSPVQPRRVSVSSGSDRLDVASTDQYDESDDDDARSEQSVEELDAEAIALQDELEARTLSLKKRQRRVSELRQHTAAATMSSANGGTPKQLRQDALRTDYSPTVLFPPWPSLSPSPAKSTGSPRSQRRHEELTRLRVENAQLRAEISHSSPVAATRGGYSQQEHDEDAEIGELMKDHQRRMRTAHGQQDISLAQTEEGDSSSDSNWLHHEAASTGWSSSSEQRSDGTTISSIHSKTTGSSLSRVAASTPTSLRASILRRAVEAQAWAQTEPDPPKSVQKPARVRDKKRRRSRWMSDRGTPARELRQDPGKVASADAPATPAASPATANDREQHAALAGTPAAAYSGAEVEPTLLMDTPDVTGHARMGALGYQADADRFEAEQLERERIGEEAALTISQAVSVLQSAAAETAAAAAAAVVTAVAKHRKLEADIETSMKEIFQAEQTLRELYITRLVGSLDGADNESLGVTTERVSAILDSRSKKKKRAKGGKTSPRASGSPKRKPNVPRQRPKKVHRSTRRHPPQKVAPRRATSPPRGAGAHVVWVPVRVWNDNEARERLLGVLPKRNAERSRSPGGGSQTSGSRRGPSPLRDEPSVWK